MKIYTKKATLQGIPIVPMLDILTILLIFFIVHCIAAPHLRNKPWINEKLSANLAGNLPHIGKPSAEGLPAN